MNKLVSVQNLKKEFHARGLDKGVHAAVDGVTFSIDANTIFGLVGESGCGKTTLARSMLFLDPPTSGTVLFDGKELADLSRKEMRAVRQRMQIIFQDPNGALNPRLSAYASLSEGLANRHIRAEQREQRIEQLTELVGIPFQHLKRRPKEFSTGQKQRLVIARALSMDPDFIILDEPVSSLDVSVQAHILNLLLDLKNEFSLTYLFISHDLNLVSYLSDLIAVMHGGKIVEMGTTDTIIENPLHIYTRRLFSSVPHLTGKGLNGNDAAKSAGAADFATGCAFSSFCTIKDRTCADEPQTLTDIGNGHFVACSRVAR